MQPPKGHRDLILEGRNRPYRTVSTLSESSGFTFGLEQRQDVAFADRPLDVADDLAVLLADELHLDLGTLALGAGAAEDLDDAGQYDGFVHGFFVGEKDYTCDPQATKHGKRKEEASDFDSWPGGARVTDGMTAR